MNADGNEHNRLAETLEATPGWGSVAKSSVWFAVAQSNGNSLLLLLVIAFLLSTGCASPQTLSRKGLPKGETVVFGSITPEARIVGQGMWGTSAVADIVNTHTSKILFRHPLGADPAPFYWHLPPGEYAILGVTVEGVVGPLSGSCRQSFRVYAEFSVPSDDSSWYIGNLNLKQTSAGLTSMITDNEKDATKELKTRYPTLVKNVTKALMKLEKHE